ncbi:uncharacterized protein [Linepithema humile]|uniref:uncharacterized protein n=1 Tax=Linepithema humile TaxID=83485 RepID=UPI00351EF122
MEVDAIVEMFSRSEELHGIKYSNYIGDGDSKTFKGIVDSNSYKDLTVRKKECIDHVQKRMGKQFRDLKKTTKGLDGKGKLTASLIDELTIYYGLAIRRNHDSVQKMRDAIWATLYHKISTDKNSQHDNCPQGADSWCSWQKAKAASKLHEYTYKEPLSDIVYQAIKPIYENLSTDDLLTRCLGGYTQNNNESLNALVWSIAPKRNSAGKIITDIATDVAICSFNDGYTSLMQIMQVMNIIVGTNCNNYCVEADEHRIKKAKHSLTDAAKEARKDLKHARKKSDEADEEAEGQLYGAGIAD